MKQSLKTATTVLDFELLLGFGNLAECIDGDVNFQDETVAARLGAKVGAPKEEEVDPD